MNRYSLNVYQVVCLVIGLCCVWCSSGEDSDERVLIDSVNPIKLDSDANENLLNGDVQRNRLDRDNQKPLECIEISKAMGELEILKNNQTKRIYLIKQRQQNLEEEKQEAFENMNSTQSDYSSSGKPIERLAQKEVYVLSLLVKEKLIQESVDIIILQLKEWSSTYTVGEDLTGLHNIVKQVNRLNEIKSNLTDLENQSQPTQFESLEQSLETERTTIETRLIEIGQCCGFNELTERFKAIIVTELEKMLEQRDTTMLTELFQKPEIELETMLSKFDITLSLADMTMSKGLKAIISSIDPEINDLLRNDKLTGIDQIWGKVYNKLDKVIKMNAMPVGERLLYATKQVLRRQLLGYLRYITLAGFGRMYSDLNGSYTNSKFHPSAPAPASDYYTCKCGFPHNTQSAGLKSNELSKTPLLDITEASPSNLNQKDSKINLDSEQQTLLEEFLSESSICWALFDLDNVDNSKLHVLSNTTTLQFRDGIDFSLAWEEDRLKTLLHILNKLSKIELNANKVNLRDIRNPTALLVASQLLKLFEKSRLNANQGPITICMCLDLYSPSSSLAEQPFNGVAQQEQFRSEIESIEESRYILELQIKNLTSDMQKLIWPLATHLSVLHMDIDCSLVDETNFLDDVNWRDQFTLTIGMSCHNGVIVNLGTRTAKGKDLPICKHLTITSDFSYEYEDSWDDVVYPKVYVVNLDGYLQPKSFDTADQVLTTEVTLSIEVLVSYAIFGPNQSMYISNLLIKNTPEHYNMNDITTLSNKLIGFYRTFIEQNQQALSPSLPTEPRTNISTVEFFIIAESVELCEEHWNNTLCSSEISEIFSNLIVLKSDYKQASNPLLNPTQPPTQSESQQ
ncbi:hypothetical protein NEHOM01_1261 [Nematocida homosporus]|uniref:uncharacterized protein n=1 Tax=Nematocida homosporus TaxID=1912981 RepID=UPI00221F3E40|nr:uncharacterized protein NEHOM01_1261 [Nematocida homosporus]KAI5186079.1 hypothetical protein NEHOM01_1261 [Nematocida homosporus]